MQLTVVDAHVHFWDPAALYYSWLDEIPSLDRAFLPADYGEATGEAPISRIIFIEANCQSDEAPREVAWVEHLAEAEPRIAGLVAFADVAKGLGRTLDALARSPRVKGIRQNIQGQPAGFCVQPAFVDGVREVGRRGLTFDLCATHDLLGDVVQLVDRCPDTRFVLDHCGKPAIRNRRLDPWRRDIATLAAHQNVSCKLSGLLTEAPAEGWSDDDLLPYAEFVCESFGAERVMYGSDWPVVTLAGSYCDWYRFTERLTAGWSAGERSCFYEDNAARVYGL